MEYFDYYFTVFYNRVMMKTKAFDFSVYIGNPYSEMSV